MPMVTVRVTDEEHARYQARAKEAGTTLSALARAAWDPPQSVTPRAALEAWERTWLARVRRETADFATVRRGLDTVLRALR